MNNKVLNVMELAMKFVDKLNDKQLDKIIVGEYKFDITKKDRRKVKNTKINNKEDLNIIKDASEVVKEFESREEAFAFISNLKFTKDNLMKLGNELGLNISKREKKSRIIEIMVEDTVGTKLKKEGLRAGIIGKKYSK